MGLDAERTTTDDRKYDERGMLTDLVAALREHQIHATFDGSPCPCIDCREKREAADEIERLRAVVQQARILHDEWGATGNHFEAFSALRTILGVRDGR